MSDPNADLKRRLKARLEEKQFERKFIADYKEAFEMVLADERIVLSRPERNRLFKQILWEVPTNMIEEHT